MSQETDRLDPVGPITHGYAYELISEAQSVMGEVYPHLLLIGLHEECGLQAIGMANGVIHYDPEIVLSVTMEQLLDMMEQAAIASYLKSLPLCSLLPESSGLPN